VRGAVNGRDVVHETEQQFANAPEISFVRGRIYGQFRERAEGPGCRDEFLEGWGWHSGEMVGRRWWSHGLVLCIEDENGDEAPYGEQDEQGAEDGEAFPETQGVSLRLGDANARVFE
jgi:hypothetical protein